MTGVTTSFASIEPLMPFFWFLPSVCRAARVAIRFAAAMAFCSAVSSARALGGASPNFASVSIEPLCEFLTKLALGRFDASRFRDDYGWQGQRRIDIPSRPVFFKRPV